MRRQEHSTDRWILAGAAGSSRRSAGSLRIPLRIGAADPSEWIEDPVLRDAAAGRTAFRRVTSQAKVHTVFVLCPHGMPCLLYKYLRIHLNEWQMDKMA